MKRAVVICPGRGSYSRTSLGYLKGLESEKLEQADQFREDLGRPTVSEMDLSEKFRSKLHIAGENASILTAGIAMADFDQISQDFDIVAITGNSMGFYTALGLSGALDLPACFKLVETMAEYQKNNVIGGQILYPLIDDEWQRLPEREALVQYLIDTIPDLHWSIKLGGQAVLGGTKAALEKAIKRLPEIEMNGIKYPFQLPLHSAFHTIQMNPAHRQAIRDLDDLPIQTPKIPLIDGKGHIWQPRACSSEALLDYTLGEQVIDVYDFRASVRAALRNFAPEVIILLGPGSNLGSAIAHVIIEEEWDKISSKSEFIAQQKEKPFVLAMARADQRPLVISGTE